MSTNILYIADYGNHRIMSYTAGASSGTLIASGNGNGTNQTQLSLPMGVHFDAFSNSLFITNYASHMVVRWVLGENRWTLVAGDPRGVSGNTSTLLFNPRDVTLDPMGNIYIVDRSNHRIQLYMVGETNGITIAGVAGVRGSNATLLNVPRSVELDNQLNLYVADTDNHRIQKFLRF